MRRHRLDPHAFSPDAFRAFVTQIKERSDAVINLTTGGAPTMTVRERMQPALQLAPEVASLNMGSMNFGLFPMLQRYKEFQHDWEPKFLETTRDTVSKNLRRHRIRADLRHRGAGAAGRRLRRRRGRCCG